MEFDLIPATTSVSLGTATSKGWLLNAGRCPTLNQNIQIRASTSCYGQSWSSFPQFRSALEPIFLCTQVVVPKNESTSKRPVSRRRSLWKATFFFFGLSFRNNRKILVAFSCGVLLSEGNSETGFGQLLKLPGVKVFRFSFESR